MVKFEFMDSWMLVYLGIGLLTGCAIGFLLAIVLRPRKEQDTDNKQYKLELKLERERSEALQKEFNQLNSDLKAERESVLQLNSQNASLSANYKNLQEKLNEQKTELSKLQEQFTAQFRNLANEIFEEKSKKFTDQNKTNLYELLKPLGEKITDFEKKVEETNKENLERSTALREQIIGLRELNKKMSADAENLTNALKGNTRIQGDWGEMILERILEQSGLTKDREYFTQESYNTDEGRRLRPDVVIRLPEHKNLVIDAKASLTSYERYVNAENEEDRERALKEHLISVKSHIKSLSDKNYNQLFDGGSLDYVLMFVPIEAAFALIVQHGGELYNDAHNKNIIIVSPATLVATLRTVANIWKHEYQNRNALEIARQGGALYDKFKSFVDDLVKVGQSLKSTQSTYEEAMKKLYSGKDNLIRKTERLKELGAKASKTMDQKLLDRAEIMSEQGLKEEPFKQPDLFGG